MFRADLSKLVVDGDHAPAPIVLSAQLGTAQPTNSTPMQKTRPALSRGNAQKSATAFRPKFLGGKQANPIGLAEAG